MATSWGLVLLILTFLCTTSTAATSKEMTKRCLNKITSCQLRLGACLCTVADGRCPCCKDCRECLGHRLWDDCRDVANLNPNNISEPKPYDRKVVVGSLDMPMPDLFVSTCSHVQQLELPMDVYNVTERDKIGLIEMNCTVAAHRCCMDLEGCIGRCKELGATRFRWHSDCRSTSSVKCGCCECEGSGCIREIDSRGPMCKVCSNTVSVAKMAEDCKTNTIPTDTNN